VTYAQCVDGEVFGRVTRIGRDAWFAYLAPTEPILKKEEAESRIAAMYATYRQEISYFLAHARPVLHQRPRHLRKDNERDLFAAAG
jgi:hypothetical protein